MQITHVSGNRVCPSENKLGNSRCREDDGNRGTCAAAFGAVTTPVLLGPEAVRGGLGLAGVMRAPVTGRVLAAPDTLSEQTSSRKHGAISHETKPGGVGSGHWLAGSDGYQPVWAGRGWHGASRHHGIFLYSRARWSKLNAKNQEKRIV
jgi:hypothetical protein